ncbi:MAG: glutathione S-transferase family protein [Kofleriaceae bacterium]
MKLYFHPLSGCSRRALLVIAHLELPVERIVVDLTRGEHRAAAHLTRNPNGLVPVLDDDGFLLWESRAIMQYLADITPGQTLLPTEPRGRADVNRWLAWCASHMAPAVAVLVRERFVKPLTGGAADPVEEGRGEALVTQHAPVLDRHLADRTWVSQDRLTLADLSLAAGFALAGPARVSLERYPHLAAWLTRVQALDAWTRTAPPVPARA